MRRSQPTLDAQGQWVSPTRPVEFCELCGYVHSPCPKQPGTCACWCAKKPKPGFPSPGPWFYKAPTKAMPSAWIYAQDDRTICELNDNRDEYEANARLIAEAPELLRAAQALVTAWTTPVHSTALRQQLDEDIRNAEGALRAAVERAQGRTP